MLITVAGPRKSIDLELPDETPVGELIPLIVQALGLASGNPQADGANVWGLALQQGQPLNPRATLADTGIMDGAILALRQLTAWRAQPAPAAQRPSAQPVSQLSATPTRTPVAARRITQGQATPTPPYRPQAPHYPPTQPQPQPPQPAQQPNPGGIGIRWNKDGL